MIALKTALHGTLVAQFQCGESVLWGIHRSAKQLGLSLTVFEIGGIDLRDAADLRPLLVQVRGSHPRPLAIQFMSTFSGSYNSFFRRLAMTDPPFIVDDLALDTRSLRFNFFSGIRDYI